MTVKLAPILPLNQVIISAVGKKKKKKIELTLSKTARLLPSQLFPFPSIMLTGLSNDAAKGRTCETTEFKLSKAIIHNHHHDAYVVPPIWGP